LSVTELEDDLPKLHTNKKALSARAYPHFCSMKQFSVLRLTPQWDAGPSKSFPSTLCHWQLREERGDMERREIVQ